MTERRFMDPLEVPPIPGTEGWEEMYSYYQLFNRDDPRRIEDERSRLWFCGSIHLPEPLYPLDSNLACDLNYAGISAIANRQFRVPPLRGFDYRVLNGRVYLHGLEVEDPEQLGARAQVFEPRIGRVLENWPDEYRGCFEEADRLIAAMKALEFDALLEVEPDSTLDDLQRHYPVAGFYSQYLELWDLLVKMGQQTKKMLLPAYAGYLVFLENMRKLFPGIPDRAISQMVQGFESKLFRPTEALQQLAHAAVDGGLADALLSHERWADLSAALQRDEAGRGWLAQLEAARDPWFEVTAGEGWQKQSVAWNDDLDIPLASVRTYVRALRAGETIERPREDALRERDRVTAEYRALIDNEPDAAGFDRLVEMTRHLAPASEDHNLYQGSLFHSLYTRKMRQIGALIARHGILAEPEDVFLLNRHDLDAVMWELYTSWSRGVEPAGRFHWPRRIERRKQIMEAFHGWAAPPALGRIPEVIRNPFAIVHFGITPERIESWLETGDDDGDGSTLKGFAGSPGVVEGTARICTRVEDLAALRAGEIMVTPTTAPNWAPAFQLVRGCVTDMGGVFCHAAIVAREYGMPAVVGTGWATARIRTGDRVRIDGEQGTVEILERA